MEDNDKLMECTIVQCCTQKSTKKNHALMKSLFNKPTKKVQLHKGEKNSYTMHGPNSWT